MAHCQVHSVTLLSHLHIIKTHSTCKTSALCCNTPGNSNFQVLVGDVDLGPLSEHPELFKAAAVQNEVVNVTDDQQTAVVTVGVDIRLDWSSWVTEVLDVASALNATFLYYRIKLNESGSAAGPTKVLQPSERVAIRSNEELNLFYVEITCAVLAPENESDSAIYELEACIPEPAGSQQCYRSNITVYAIERPPPLCKTNLIIKVKYLYYYHNYYSITVPLRKRAHLGMSAHAATIKIMKIEWVTYLGVSIFRI